MSLLGDKLRELRGDLSYYDVGQAIGIPRSAIRDFEIGKYLPSPEKLRLLSEYYDVPYIELRALFYQDMLTDAEERQAMRLCIENCPEPG